MTRAAPIHPATRAEVLALVGEIGVSAAARQTGHKATTIRKWQERHGKAAAAAIALVAPDLDPTTPGNLWREQLPTLVDNLARAAALALEKTASALQRGDGPAAQRFATTLGIIIDKAQLTSGAATSRTESAVKTVSFLARTGPDVVAELAGLRAELAPSPPPPKELA